MECVLSQPVVGTMGGSGSGASSVLVPGDMVEVTEGDLMNLHGKVVSVDGNTITILPRHQDLKVGGYSGIHTQDLVCPHMLKFFH